jgi:6-pyruvoyltetrahydropterin/6-carboxytetrahydropterin synthase
MTSNEARPQAFDSSQRRTRIGRTYRFESAHRLPRLPVTHKCHHMHGHNYRAAIVVAGTLDERGFVKDFAEIDAEVMPLIATLDHKVLNDVPGLENPTAEVIAAWLFARISDCESVRVYENDDCWAEVGK